VRTSKTDKVCCGHGPRYFSQQISYKPRITPLRMIMLYRVLLVTTSNFRSFWGSPQAGCCYNPNKYCCAVFELGFARLHSVTGLSSATRLSLVNYLEYDNSYHARHFLSLSDGKWYELSDHDIAFKVKSWGMTKEILYCERHNSHRDSKGLRKKPHDVTRRKTRGICHVA
jgi:hypothetical protein